MLNKLDVLDLFVVEVDARLQVDRQLDIVKLFDLPDVDVRQEFLQLLIVLLACGIGCVGDLEGRIAYRCSKRTRRLSAAARRQALRCARSQVTLWAACAGGAVVERGCQLKIETRQPTWQRPES